MPESPDQHELEAAFESDEAQRLIKELRYDWHVHSVESKKDTLKKIWEMAEARGWTKEDFVQAMVEKIHRPAAVIRIILDASLNPPKDLEAPAAKKEETATPEKGDSLFDVPSVIRDLQAHWKQMRIEEKAIKLQALFRFIARELGKTAEEVFVRKMSSQLKISPAALKIALGFDIPQKTFNQFPTLAAFFDAGDGPAKPKGKNPPPNIKSANDAKEMYAVVKKQGIRPLELASLYKKLYHYEIEVNGKTEPEALRAIAANAETDKDIVEALLKIYDYPFKIRKLIRERVIDLQGLLLIFHTRKDMGDTLNGFAFITAIIEGAGASRNQLSRGRMNPAAIRQIAQRTVRAQKEKERAKKAVVKKRQLDPKKVYVIDHDSKLAKEYEGHWGDDLRPLSPDEPDFSQYQEIYQEPFKKGGTLFRTQQGRVVCIHEKAVKVK